jgi:hypothetical protein
MTRQRFNVIHLVGLNHPFAGLHFAHNGLRRRGFP